VAVSVTKTFNNTFPILEQAVYMSWWPSLTQEMQQNRSVLERYERHRAEWFERDKKTGKIHLHRFETIFRKPVNNRLL